VSTHVLDAGSGRPAAGVPVVLERQTDTGWDLVAQRVTDADGRVADLAAETGAGVHRLRFDVDAYAPGGFFPEVTIAFRITDPAGHHHVPLLLSPFAYSTYRGS
jgi:5-hydroxyisourate hydrolase